jgi:hypothetical protein
MRTLLRSVALVLIAGVAWGARIPPCPAGRFIVDGVPLVPGDRRVRVHRHQDDQPGQRL